jgi:hypothetical protein
MSELAMRNNDDGFAVQDKDGGGMISGKMVQFVDGKFIIDKVETVPAGTELIAMAMITAWVHWQDSKPVEHRITLLGRDHPDRNDLPDQDESLWPPGLGDQPSDPWKDTRYLHLMNPKSGADFTFVSDSYGGRRAVSDLKRQISNMRGMHPTAVPIVQLAATEMKTKFGKKLRPDFKVIGWRDNGQAQPEPAAKVLAKPAALANPASANSDMDDDIPF